MGKNEIKKINKTWDQPVKRERNLRKGKWRKREGSGVL